MYGFHHLRKRMRAARHTEAYSVRSTKIRVLDYVMYGVGVLAPFALVPQLLQIYSTKSSEGVSFLTWVLLTIANVLWVLYAAVHKDNHILFSSGFMIIFQLMIVIGVLLY